MSSSPSPTSGARRRNWQQRVRLLIVVSALAFAAALASTFRPRPAPPAAPSIGSTDPKAIVESAEGSTHRFNLNQEEVRVEYRRQLTYQDGSNKLEDVTVTTERAGGRTFVIKGRQAEVAPGDSRIVLAGDVVMTASDGLQVETDQATYSQNDGVVRAEGPVAFRRGRTVGSGVGLHYTQQSDTLHILSQVVVDVSADPAEGPSAGGTHITSGAVPFARQEHLLRFEGRMRAERAGQTIEGDLGIARLTAEEEKLETLEIRGNSSITGTPGAAGGLERMAGRDIDLEYASDGQTIERALVTGDGVLHLAGEPGQAGRRIEAATLELSLAPNGSTPTALTARQDVLFTLPAGTGATAVGSRVVRAQTFDSRGDPQRGLTSGRFSGDVQYREERVGPSGQAGQAGQAGQERRARSATLDVQLGPGMASIDEARFARGVRFDEGAMSATAAAARYLLGPGTLALSGSEPGMPRPHLVNELLTVDAASIDIVLAGPEVTASGAVASEMKPASKEGGAGTVMPSMLEDDQPVSVSAERLVYDGVAGRATYTGNALLWQGDTSIKGASIRLDQKTGDLAGASAEGGAVATTSAFDQRAKDGKVTRSRSVTTAKAFLYEEALKRATYTGDAHMSGPQGDLTATKIELYLKTEGDELERAEAYEAVTLVEKKRKTTGDRMTYFSVDERYLVTGAPVTIIDECGGKTIGRTLTFFQATDRILVDGNQQMRTQTQGGGSKCQ